MTKTEKRINFGHDFHKKLFLIALLDKYEFKN